VIGEDAVIEGGAVIEEYMFRFPGVLGEVIGDFARGDLVAFLGFANRGKTW